MMMMFITIFQGSGLSTCRPRERRLVLLSPGRGDYRREERLTHTLCRVRYLSIFSSARCSQDKNKKRAGRTCDGVVFHWCKELFYNTRVAERKFYY